MASHLSNRRCAELAQIVGGTPTFMDGVCLIQLLRSDLSPTILGARTRSPLVLPVFFSVEGDGSRALNLGEAVLMQAEVNTVMKVLRENGIIVTALHNHWLFEEPRLMYMHWEARMDPERFLRASLAALRAAGVQTMPLAGDESSSMEDHPMQVHPMEVHPMEFGDESGEEPAEEFADELAEEHAQEVRPRRNCNCPTCSRRRALEPWHMTHE